MKKSTFFTRVWQINGVLLLVAGVLSIGIFIFAGYKIVKDISGERYSRNIVNIEEKDNIKKEWQLGYLTKITGCPYVMIPLSSVQNYELPYYSKSSSTARNYLFINGISNEQHWLLNSHQYLIVDFTLLSKPNKKDEDTLAILYRVVKNDSNNDKRLTERDILSIGLSRPTGEGYQEILDEIDTFVGQKIINANTLLIVFKQGDINYSANVNLTDFTLYNRRKIAQVGTSPLYNIHSEAPAPE